VIHDVLRPSQGHDRPDLDRLRHAVVEVALDATQGVDHVAVAAGKTDAPARHRVTLRERRELDGHVPRARHLEDARRLVALEADFRVGEVVKHHQVVLPRERDDPLEEGTVHHRRRRIVRERQDQHLRLGPGAGDRLLEIGDEVGARGEGHVAQVAPGDDGRILVDRIRGVGTQHNVSRTDRHQHEMRQALLGSDHGDGLAVRIERDPVAALVPLGGGGAQVRDAARGRVAVVARVAGGFPDLVDHVRRRGEIRVSHAQVDDVLARAAGGLHQVDDLGQDVGGQPVELVEVVTNPFGHAAAPL
jgi:hypothetical protein